MGKEQEGISDARGHENEQRKEKNRLRQEKKQGKTNVSMHEALCGNAFQQGHRTWGLVTNHS